MKETLVVEPQKYSVDKTDFLKAQKGKKHSTILGKLENIYEIVN